jgi:hypothetical protein
MKKYKLSLAGLMRMTKIIFTDNIESKISDPIIQGSIDLGKVSQPFVSDLVDIAMVTIFRSGIENHPEFFKEIKE